MHQRNCSTSLPPVPHHRPPLLLPAFPSSYLDWLLPRFTNLPPSSSASLFLSSLFRSFSELLLPRVDSPRRGEHPPFSRFFSFSRDSGSSRGSRFVSRRVDFESIYGLARWSRGFSQNGEGWSILCFHDLFSAFERRCNLAPDCWQILLKHRERGR